MSKEISSTSAVDVNKTVIRQRNEQEQHDDADDADTNALSESQRKTKRARTDASTVFSFEWPNEPVEKDSDGRECYHQVQISSKGGTFMVNKGDAVVLANEKGSESMVFYVDGFCVDRDNEKKADKTPDDPLVKVQGRWFLDRVALMAKLGKHLPPDSQEFLDRLQSNELVLTNLNEEHDIAAIEKKCDVYFSQRSGSPSMPSLAGTHLCRYKLKLDPSNRTLEWAEWDSEAQPAAQNDAVTVDSLSSEVEEEEEVDDESTSASSENINKVTIQEGEGTMLRGDIQIGPNFQMKVEPFVERQEVASRNPKLIFKAGQIDEEKLQTFYGIVAVSHTPFLSRQGLMLDEPYSPLPLKQVEAIMRNTPGYRPPTGSSMSTASALGGTRSRLSKECDADSLLEVLADSDFDTDRAVETIQADMYRITVAWTRAEKDLFDDGFRRHHGNLRAIAKAIGPTKSMKDVIDYFYRFKIPDQFRKYQNKKLEQAVRIVECIEKRKYHESLSGSSTAFAANNNHGGKEPHWSEKSVSVIADSREMRVLAARRLLLDVKESFGKDVMGKVGAVIRQLQISYESESRDELLGLLDGKPELQKRFLEYLPKHF